MAVAPFVTEDILEPMGDARWAMAFAGVVMGITCFICTFIFRARNRIRMQLQNGRNLIAHWTFNESEWKTYTGYEALRQGDEKRILLWITAGLMVVATIGAFVANREAGIATGIILAVVWIICRWVSGATVRAKASSANATVREVRLGAAGVLLADEFHLWKGLGNKLEEVQWVEDTQQPQIEVTYSSPNRNSRVETTVRIPIPTGRENEAREAIRRLKK